VRDMNVRILGSTTTIGGDGKSTGMLDICTRRGSLRS
jgi:hypothetical protein